MTFLENRVASALTATLSLSPAIAFAEKKGFSYRVKDKRKNRDRKIGTNYYAHNFLPAAVEAKLREEGKNTVHFANPKVRI